MDMQILGVWFEQFAQQITWKLKTQTETGSESETETQSRCGFSRTSGWAGCEGLELGIGGNRVF